MFRLSASNTCVKLRYNHPEDIAAICQIHLLRNHSVVHLGVHIRSTHPYVVGLMAFCVPTLVRLDMRWLFCRY